MPSSPEEVAEGQGAHSGPPSLRLGVHSLTHIPRQPVKLLVPEALEEAEG